MTSNNEAVSHMLDGKAIIDIDIVKSEEITNFDLIKEMLMLMWGGTSLGVYNILKVYTNMKTLSLTMMSLVDN